MAVITGGTGGLGSALASALSLAGYVVEAPPRSELDVTSVPGTTAYFTRFPRIDLLILNAGTTADAPFLRLTEADWDRVLETNLAGAARCARAVLPGMMTRQTGHIVAIGSSSAWRPPIGQAAYAAAKAGLVALTQCLAAEGGPSGVRANCVLPGFLDTPMTRKLSPQAIDAARKDHVLGRFNTPEDTARFIAFLDSMVHVSGQVFQLDSRLRRHF
ncbi:MAG: SDR family NAD(P)-dependent oxidoreductase [Verrucomicrobiales bacterium]